MTVTAGGDHALSRTGLFLNGRTWKNFDAAMKLGYVFGVRDGISLTTADKLGDLARGSMIYFGNSTYGEIVARVDDFYRDPANVQIPVKSAMYYFQEKVNGTSPEKLAEELAGFRKWAASQQ